MWIYEWECLPNRTQCRLNWADVTDNHRPIGRLNKSDQKPAVGLNSQSEAFSTIGTIHEPGLVALRMNEVAVY